MRWPHLSPEQRAEQLEERLYEAQQAVVELLPAPYRAHWQARYACKTWGDGREWEHQFVALALANATAVTREAGAFFGPRAYCPLCGDGGTDWTRSGYAMPEGLRRHLAGDYNAQQCRITKVVFWMLRDWGRERWAQAETDQAAAEAAARDARRAAETLYVVRDGGRPLLLDEDIRNGPWHNQTPRDAEALAWAAARLAELGFAAETAERTVTYRREIDGAVVHADPRIAGRLVFEVTTPEPPPAPTPRRRRMPPPERPREVFDLPDRVTRELPKKFAERLAGAVRLLETKRPRPRGQSSRAAATP